MNKLFSITNDEKHTIIWLLGIKMSFLRKFDFYYVEPNKNNNIDVIENGVRKQLTHKIPGLNITITLFIKIRRQQNEKCYFCR